MKNKFFLAVFFVVCGLFILPPGATTLAYFTGGGAPTGLYIAPTSTTWDSATISVIDTPSVFAGCREGNWGDFNFYVDQFLLEDVNGTVLQSTTIRQWPFDATTTFSEIGFTPPATDGYYELIAEEGDWQTPCGRVSYNVWTDGGMGWFYLTGGSNITKKAGPLVLSFSTSSLGQYEADGTTPIPDRGLAAGNTVVFSAILQSTEANPLQFQIEVEPSSTPFTDQPTATSASTTPGTLATIMASDLPPGAYHWQARILDTVLNATSSWQTLSVPPAEADFEIGTPTGPAYHFIDRSDVIRAGNGHGPLSVRIKLGRPLVGTVSTTLSLTLDQGGATDVCGVPGYVLQGYADSNYQNADGPAYSFGGWTDASGTPITSRGYSGLITGTAAGRVNSFDYYTLSFGACDMYWSLSIAAAPGATYSCTHLVGLDCYDADVVGQPFMTLASPAPVGSESVVVPTIVSTSLQQYMAGGAVTIFEGSTTTENEIVLEGIPQSSSTNNLELQFELSTSTDPNNWFANSIAATSTPVALGQIASATISGLPDGQYHWQARAMDIVTSAVSDWQEFGTAGDTDFIVFDLGQDAAHLAKLLISAPYLGDGKTFGGKGWDMVLNQFAPPDAVKTTGYHYWNNALRKVLLGEGLDCSGLVMWAYDRSFSPGTSWYKNFVVAQGADEQYRYNTTSTDESRLRPGDLMFFDNIDRKGNPGKDGHMDHVAMYVGESGGYDVVSAASPGKGIIPVSKDVLKQQLSFVAFKRVIPASQIAMRVSSRSPINLAVTDPDGFTITPTTIVVSTEEYLREIPGTLYYSQMELGTDGLPEDTVYSYTAKTGDYTIKAFPVPGVAPTATYSMDFSTPYQTVTMAQNIPVGQMPAGGYHVHIDPAQRISQTAISRLSPSADTYLAPGAANKNKGKEKTLNMRYARSLVQFGQGQLQSVIGSGTVMSATLTFSVAKSAGLGKAGDTIELHRMTMPWTELGATWNCPNDTNTKNSIPNCVPKWDMDNPSSYPFTPSSTATALITKYTTNTVSFDITSDLVSFMAGTPNYGWIIKRANKGINVPGAIDFYSREANNGPILTVSYKTQ